MRTACDSCSEWRCFGLVRTYETYRRRFKSQNLHCILYTLQLSPAVTINQVLLIKNTDFASFAILNLPLDPISNSFKLQIPVTFPGFFVVSCHRYRTNIHRRSISCKSLCIGNVSLVNHIIKEQMLPSAPLIRPPAGKNNPPIDVDPP